MRTIGKNRGLARLADADGRFRMVALLAKVFALAKIIAALDPCLRFWLQTLERS